MTENLRLKRAYEPPTADDGERYLVDRLWPRGVKKEGLALTGWLKDVAPSETRSKIECRATVALAHWRRY
jgi:uncharacterized protein YeaO (DUF488 family)